MLLLVISTENNTVPLVHKRGRKVKSAI